MRVSYVLLVTHVHVGGPQGSPTGAQTPLTAGVAYALVAAAAIAIGPVVTGARVRRVPRLVIAALLVLCDATLVVDGRGTTAVLTAVHLTAVVVWLGGVLVLAVRRRGVARNAVQAFTPWAVTSATVVAATGVVLAVRDRIGLIALVSTAFGAVVLIKATMLLGAGALGLGHQFGRQRWAPVLLRTECGVLAITLAFGAALIAVPLTAPAVDVLGPGLAAIRLGSAGTATIFTAAVQGHDAVLLLSDESVGVQESRAAPIEQLEPGRVLSLAQRGRRVRLRIFSGTSVVEVSPPVQPVAALPAGGLPALVAHDLAVGAAPDRGVPCLPSAVSLAHAVGVLLRERRLTHLAVVSDASTYGQDFAGALRAVATGRHQRPLRTLVVATGSARARQILTSLAGTSTYRAVVLAPWLLDRDVFATIARLELPPVLVAARSDAMAPIADRYRGALAALGDGLAPTAAGLDAYAGAVGSLADRSLTLYAAAPVGFLPGVLDVGHTHGSATWLPGGSLVAVTRPSPVTCTTSTTTGAADQ